MTTQSESGQNLECVLKGQEGSLKGKAKETPLVLSPKGSLPIIAQNSSKGKTSPALGGSPDRYQEVHPLIQL